MYAQVQTAQQVHRMVERAGTRGCTTTDMRENLRLDMKQVTILTQDLVFNFGIKTKADFKGKSLQYR